MRMNWKAICASLVASGALALAACGQETEAESDAANGHVAGQIGDIAGTGPNSAIAQAREDAPQYTFYRQAELPDEPLPLVLWGNGGCRDNGLSASHFLREIASNGYIVIANGTQGEEREVLESLPTAEEIAQAAPPPPHERTPDETSVEQLLAAITYAEGVNADPKDELAGHIDTQRIAVMGHSCGGLQALSAGTDPRIDTVIAFASGVYNRPNTGLSGVHITKDDLARLHAPMAYVLGGPTDIAFENGSDDFERIDHIPVVLANQDVGHGGTFALANGGDWAQFGVQWLDWQLKGSETAARRFVGEDCGYCTKEAWTFERKNFPQDQ